MKSLKPPIVVLLIAAGVFAIYAIANRGRGGGAEAVPWGKDLEQAKAAARQQNKPVFAYFTASWCGPCQRMAKTTWTSADVARALEGYVPVKLDIDDHGALAQQYGVNGVPTMMVLDANGQMHRATVGGRSPEQMIAWLKDGQ